MLARLQTELGPEQIASARLLPALDAASPNGAAAPQEEEAAKA
jgi:hypothetical protein